VYDRAVAEINRDGGIFNKDAGKKIPVQYKWLTRRAIPQGGEVASPPDPA
jgi:hypothetical protein